MNDLNQSSEPLEPGEKPALPWVGILVALVLFGLAGAWVMHAKSSRSVVEALETELAQDKTVLSEERAKVFDMTAALQEQKDAINAGQAQDRAKAVEEYNRLAAEQRAQREKVREMTERYNEKVTKLQELR